VTEKRNSNKFNHKTTICCSFNTDSGSRYFSTTATIPCTLLILTILVVSLI